MIVSINFVNLVLIIFYIIYYIKLYFYKINIFKVIYIDVFLNWNFGAKISYLIIIYKIFFWFS